MDAETSSWQRRDRYRDHIAPRADLDMMRARKSLGYGPVVEYPIMQQFLYFFARQRVLTLSVAALVVFLIITAFATIFKPDVSRWTGQLFVTLSSLGISLCGAALWVGLISLRHRIARMHPVHTVYPFCQACDERVYIILATVPSTTGQTTTGMGEARALALLLDAFHSSGMPSENIETNFSGFYLDADMHRILSHEHAILLGGPNHNSFSREVLDKHRSKLAYLFEEDSSEIERDYTGAIIRNLIEPELVSCPKPDGVTSDPSVTADCGLIVRVKNESGRTTTILAGGMTPGVWIAARATIAPRLVYEWWSRLETTNAREQFQFVVESSIEHILSSPEHQISVLCVAPIGE